MDSPLLFAIFAFLTLMVAMTGVGYRLYYKPGRMLRQLGAPVISTDQKLGMADPAQPQGSTIVTMLTSIGSKIPSAEAEVPHPNTDLVRGGDPPDKARPGL